MSGIGLPLLLASLFSLPSSLHAQNLDLGTEAQREAGKKLYLNYCAHCHGSKGDGKGVAYKHFNPQPRDFTSGKYKVRTTASGELPTTEDIRRIIRMGMPFSVMPAFTNLTEEEITALAYYLKTFNEDFTDPDFVPVPLQFPKAPKYTEESAKRGRDVYVANECYTCHGDQGRTDGTSAPTLEDDFGSEIHHIRPADLTKRWAFRGGPSREDIYRTFTTGLNGTPMPSYEDSIAEADRWDLVNYVYSLSDRDVPGFATTVIGQPVEGTLDLSKGKSLFEKATPAFFPVVGQVIEPGREFFPSANALEVRVVFNAEDIAVLLTWHDMTADTSGNNAPDRQVDEETMPSPTLSSGEESPPSPFSDAVAIQWPEKMPDGFKKPYFILGDRKNAVDLWFLDLAQKNKVRRYKGEGYRNLVENPSQTLAAAAAYEAGEWAVIFKQKRNQKEGLSFPEGEFIPLSFYLWDGFNRERGIKTGLTAWYSLYLKPADAKSPLRPILSSALAILGLELLVIFFVRRKYGRETETGETGG